MNLKKNAIKTVTSLRKIFKEKQYDIVVSPALISIIVSSALSKSLNTKLISWDHGSISLNKKTFSTEYWVRKHAAEKSDCLVVITKAAKDVYHRRYDNIKMIKQIYNTTNFSVSDQKEYDSTVKKVISAGSFDYIKGFDIAINVAQKALKDHPDWEWHIYGDGKEKEKIKTMIQEADMCRQIKLMGRTNKINEVYPQYSFFVLPSRQESFGMVILEAQCSNLPIVAFNCPYGPNELILDGENGFLIEPYSVDEMANKIEILINDSKLREKMSKNARVLSHEMNKNKIVDEWKNLLYNI